MITSASKYCCCCCCLMKAILMLTSLREWGPTILFRSFQPRNGARLPMTCFSRSGPQVGVTKGKFSRWNVILTLTLHNTSSIYAMLSQQKKKNKRMYHVTLNFNRFSKTGNSQTLLPLCGVKICLSPQLGKNTESGSTLMISGAAVAKKKHRSTNSSIFLCELHSKFHQSSDSSISFSKNLNSVIMLSITLHSSTRWCSSRSLEVIALIVTDSGAT